MNRLPALALVAVGGAAGACCRHAVVLTLPGSFPWGTLAVNVAGCFLLGLVVFSGLLPPAPRLAVGTGFLSSFTTYSAFAAETAALAPTLGAANVAANYGLGIAAALAARRLAGER